MPPKPLTLLGGLLLGASLSNASLAQQTPADDASTEDYPSQQLLEFLADFGDVDEQTYELIEYHALQRDRNKAQEKSDDE